MKQFILGSFIVTTALFIFYINYFKETPPFRHKCVPHEIPEDYSKVYIPIRFIPGQEKCLKYKKGSYTLEHYRDLKEFIITKNNKYCLWDSKNWDEECQDAAMAYAYGDYDDEPEALKKYKKFKDASINFIKHIQANDIEKALIFAHDKAMFFTDDINNCLVQEKSGFNGYCRSYFNRKKNKGYGVMNLELFRKNLMQIDVDNIKFYLSDLSKSYIYSVVIPYEYNGFSKYLDIRFDCDMGGGDPAYPYDKHCYPKIYDLGINSKLPGEN